MSGKEFRRWRRLNDITQSKVADMCNVDESIISKWENDKTIITESNYDELMKFVKYAENNINN